MSPSASRVPAGGLSGAELRDDQGHLLVGVAAQLAMVQEDSETSVMASTSRKAPMAATPPRWCGDLPGFHPPGQWLNGAQCTSSTPG